MGSSVEIKSLVNTFVVTGEHQNSDYFGLIRKLVSRRNQFARGDEEYSAWQNEIDNTYDLILDELTSNNGQPVGQVKFGTSGWRGIIGKDLFVKSVKQVALAIVELYREIETDDALREALGVECLSEAKQKGCVLGFDNRFGGELLAGAIMDVLTGNGFTVHYAGESTTGVLSAALLELEAAFSINLTPSHNPMEYGGIKFNAADGGPAATIITNRITEKTRQIISEDRLQQDLNTDASLVKPFDSLAAWKSMVRKNKSLHGLDYDKIMSAFAGDILVVAVDCVHGASRIHIDDLFKGIRDSMPEERLLVLRGERDPTFGGIAPEPSPANMNPVIEVLIQRPESFKLGMVIDPDGDRIRFTDGTVDLDMNKFGAMAYHFLHIHKGLKGMVAKTVATSNFANKLAADFGEEIFEPRVGFKEFKPVIGKALVCFEESDGITVIGHTPEKDAYIGLLLALDMVLSLKKNLGEYLLEIQTEHGFYFPSRDGVVVSQQGEDLRSTLAQLDRYGEDTVLRVGDKEQRICAIIDIDGRKMIFEDGSWLMIRPSGTEPKIRFYVEARDEKSKSALFETARDMLREIGLLE
jgi:phosphomannomutase